MKVSIAKIGEVVKEIMLEEGATVADLRDILPNHYPAISGNEEIIVAGEVSTDDYELSEGQMVEVGFSPATMPKGA